MKYLSLAIALILSLTKLYSQKNYFQLPVSIPSSIQNPLISGAPGPSSRIMIRCSKGTVSESEPLFIVDGIPFEANEIKSINPTDILEITVLKDAALAAIYGNRPLNGVVLITTKKQYCREFVVRDAKSLLGVGNATIEARSTKTGKSFFFTADEFGKLVTDSLMTNEYDITVSSTGYKTSKLSLKSILQNKGEIKLEPAFLELDEVVVIGQVISCRRMISTCCMQESYCGMFVCTAKGVVIKKEQQPEGIVISKTGGRLVYPNPVAASGTINISFPNVKPGQYQIRMLNAAGQLFYSFQKQITGKGETEQIHLNGNTLPEIYVVQIVDEQKKLVQTSKIVVQ